MAHQAHLQMLADLAAWIMQKRLARMSSYSLHMMYRTIEARKDGIKFTSKQLERAATLLQVSDGCTIAWSLQRLTSLKDPASPPAQPSHCKNICPLIPRLDVKGLIDILQRLLHTWLLPFPSFTGQQCKVRGAAKGVGGAGVWNEMAANRAGLAVLPQFRLRHCKYCCKL
eukprot:scaffold75490_cov19-Tisochrysis_lutea.AAC.4